ncbi:hypothetical protein [Brucella anthropi]|uniref:hypothetical protein n=1 Tax=Brucella anthropi TaxID=529 RepID=UPI00320819B4
MKFRFHRGSLADSMKTVKEVQNRDDLIALITDEVDLKPTDHIHIKPYGYDKRIGWDTYMVKVDGFGPVGFLDGPMI